ncbi:MAG: endo-1,4-beta-xylanase [Acetatifactor sp.]|nr:endo-1,4-beta-xylanase [Acetatifactor sp.]
MEHRKSTKRLQLVDKTGKVLGNQCVEIKLVNHEFLFGSGAFDALPATAGSNTGSIDFYQDNVNPKQAFYRDRVNKWLGIFNYGTIPFYWGGFEPEEGHPMTDSRMAAAKYLQAHGARIKGHPLCWHTACADWLMKYDNATILSKQLDRINRDVTKFKGVVDMWDVINEVVIMPVYDRYDNAITRICKQYGRVKLVKEVFEAAKAANPDAVLLINDFNLSESYRILIDGCLHAGVPISAIGIQTHQHQGYMGRKKLEDILERFSAFGLPLHFTENTLVSGEIMPAHIVDLNDYQVEKWPTTPEGEERQMKEWKEMYEILFGHPMVEAITGWDFADGAWLHAPSGIIREDNTLKPSYLELQRLVKEEWTTKGTLQTDAEGQFTLNGYRGTYEITVDGKKVNYKLVKNTDDSVERIIVE